MEIELTVNEARVIGALLEKELTTPEQSPLSLNSLTSACNQKSNREPVMTLSESEVQETLNQLIQRRLVSESSGSRVSKYKHRFCNTEFGTLKLNPQQLGIVTVLLLRGPQTPGELRSRSNRLCEFSDVSEVERTLEKMMMGDQPLLVKLSREPGRRESRYAHLFCGEIDLAAQAPATVDLKQRVAELEAELTQLRAENAQLKQQLATQAD